MTEEYKCKFSFKGHNWGLCKKCGKIHTHPNLTKERSKEWCENISKGRTGVKIQDIYSIKRSIDMKKSYSIGERVSWNKGKTKENDERVKKSALNMLGKKHNISEENVRQRIGRKSSMKGHNYGQCRVCNKVHGKRKFLVDTISGYKKYPDKITTRDVSKAWLCDPSGRIYTPEWRKKHGAIVKKSLVGKKTNGYFGNRNWVNGRRPNLTESKITEWIQEVGLPFIYTGNKIVPAVNISPDWTHINKKQVIEYDCRFWHQKGDEFRNNIYKESGFKVLILNEDDLKDKEATMLKIKVFENE